MKKTLYLFMLLAACSSAVKAQFCNTQKGTLLYYETRDTEKETVQTDTSCIVDVYKSGDTLIVKQENWGKRAEFGDAAEQITFRCDNDKTTRMTLMSADYLKEMMYRYYLDGYHQANPEETDEEKMKKGFDEFMEQLHCKGEVYIPLKTDAKAGDKLPESKFLYKLKPIKMTASVSNGTVIGFETLTTEAGTFNCLKVSYQAKYKIMFISESTYMTEWYAENVGLVKSEERTKRGKVMATSTLVRIEKPSI